MMDGIWSEHAAAIDSLNIQPIKHPTKKGTVTVAGKPSADVRPGTLNSILRQAGLK